MDQATNMDAPTQVSQTYGLLDTFLGPEEAARFRRRRDHNAAQHAGQQTKYKHALQGDLRLSYPEWFNAEATRQVAAFAKSMRPGPQPHNQIPATYADCIAQRNKYLDRRARKLPEPWPEIDIVRLIMGFAEMPDLAGAMAKVLERARGGARWTA
jgi:hypothetical protein